MDTIGRNEQQQLTEKLLKDIATQEDKKRLAETDAVRKLMEKQWQQAGEAVPGKEIEDRIWDKVQRKCGQAPRKNRFRKIVLTCSAACIAVLMLFSGYWLLNNRELPLEYEEVFTNTHRMLLLPDSSRVWMQPGSTLRYAQKFEKERKVWFKGDATFEVIRKETHPFRVYMNEAFVEVKGTVFRVNNMEAVRNEVTLLNGRVDLHVPITGKVIVMKPNQRARLNEHNEVEVTDVSNVGWQNGRYKFNDTRLDSLTSIITSLYDVQVTLADDVAGHYLFNGNIRFDEQPSAVIERICYNLNLKYRKENNKIIIYKRE